MKTNFQMIKDLDRFQPKSVGFITQDEVEHIKTTLCLEEMDEMGLRNCEREIPIL